MDRTNIAVSMDEQLVVRLDGLVRDRKFTNRSRAIEEAVEEKFDRTDKGTLAREAAKLDPDHEVALAEEGTGLELDLWPEY